MRKAISLTMTLVVVSVILIATAVGVLSLGGSSLSGVDNIFNRWTGQSEDDVIQSNCEQKGTDWCNDNAPDDSDPLWADEVLYDGKACNHWNRDESIWNETTSTSTNPDHSDKMPSCDTLTN